MAKDPAFLWYPADYVTGTMHLDFECKGAYIDLLMLQFQKEHMTLHMIKQVLGDKYEHIWSLISDKFETDGKFFWNQRLRLEKEKRANFCKSRKSNRNSTKDMTNHMSSHMVNVNINEDINKDSLKDRGVGEGNFSYEINLKIPPNILEAAELNQFTHTRNGNKEFVKQQWKTFLIERLAAGKKYLSISDLSEHFLNWNRTKFPKTNGNGTHKQSTTRSAKQSDITNYALEVGKQAFDELSARGKQDG